MMQSRATWALCLPGSFLQWCGFVIAIDSNAYGEHEGRFDGFKFGDANVQVDDTLFLIEP